MSEGLPNPEAKPTIGEMPKPRYIREENGRNWIGIDAYGLDGGLKQFLWWTNISNGLEEEVDRYHAAAFIARLKLEMDAEAAIGPAINLSESSRETGKVGVINETESFGVYIEIDKRAMFNFFAMMKGVKSEAKLRKKKPVEFDDAFQKARAVLPRPSQSNNLE